MSRTGNVLKNMATNIAGQGLVLLLNFIQRTVFIYTLGKDYLGLQGFVTSLLSILSLAELGLGDAIIFALYKPLAEKDNEKIQSLMQYYAKAYKIIGITIGIIGVVLLPFIEFFVTGDMPDINLYLVYLLYLFNTVSTYFFAYKRSILQADQKAYICGLYQYFFQIVQAIIQIILLIKTHDFIIYIIIQIICSIVMNIAISNKANKDYSYIKKTVGKPLTKKDKEGITKNIKALVLHKLGGVIVNNTGTLLMSKFVGIGIVGIYANYRMIITSMTNVLYQIVSAFTAGLGNLGAENDKEKLYEIYNVLELGCFWMYSFSTVCIFVLINPFVEMWVGKEYLFNIGTVALLSINFYILGMRQLVLTTRTALGLFWFDRYKPLIESIVNLVVSLILVKYLNINGIFIGTLMGYVLVDLSIEPYVLFRHGFDKGLKQYYIKYIIELAHMVVTAIITYRICSLITGNTWLIFIIKVIVCVCCSLFSLFVISCKQKEFKELKKRFFKVIRMKK